MFAICPAPPIPSSNYAAPDPILLAAEKPFNPSGIYKSSDLSTNVFVQTFDSGSMLILFTSDLVNVFHVFLDPDWSDGILGYSRLGKPTVTCFDWTFTDESTALATITYCGPINVDNWQAFPGFRYVRVPWMHRMVSIRLDSKP